MDNSAEPVDFRARAAGIVELVGAVLGVERRGEVFAVREMQLSWASSLFICRDDERCPRRRGPGSLACAGTRRCVRLLGRRTSRHRRRRRRRDRRRLGCAQVENVEFLDLDVVQSVGRLQHLYCGGGGRVGGAFDFDHASLGGVGKVHGGEEQSWVPSATEPSCAFAGECVAMSCRVPIARA